jgi:hypothetical protein
MNFFILNCLFYFSNYYISAIAILYPHQGTGQKKDNGNIKVSLILYETELYETELIIR